MSKVIQVLETMASDAALNSEYTIADFIAKSGISDRLQSAILANDVQKLIENGTKLPEIKFFSMTLPEDDEPEEQHDSDTSESNDEQAIAING